MDLGRKLIIWFSALVFSSSSWGNEHKKVFIPEPVTYGGVLGFKADITGDRRIDFVYYDPNRLGLFYREGDYGNRFKKPRNIWLNFHEDEEPFIGYMIYPRDEHNGVYDIIMKYGEWFCRYSYSSKEDAFRLVDKRDTLTIKRMINQKSK